jgi:hypothetical protein
MSRTYGTLFSSGQPVFYQYFIPNGIMANNLEPLHLNPLAKANGNNYTFKPIHLYTYTP